MGCCIDTSGWEAGDLVFFGEPADHVGFVDAQGRLYHCRAQVRIDRIGDEPALRERISGVRRWWPLRDGKGGAWTATLSG